MLDRRRSRQEKKCNAPVISQSRDDSEDHDRAYLSGKMLRTKDHCTDLHWTFKNETYIENHIAFVNVGSFLIESFTLRQSSNEM
jgi:hypothetical protein